MNKFRKLKLLKISIPLFFLTTILFIISLSFLLLNPGKELNLLWHDRRIAVLILFYILTSVCFIKNQMFRFKQNVISKKYQFNKNLLNIINNTIKYPIILIDETNQIQYWSNKSHELFNYTEEESIKKDIFTHILPNTPEDKFTNKVENKNLFKEKAINKKQKEILVSITSTPLPIDGSLWHVLTLEDITKTESFKQNIIKAKEKFELLIKYIPVSVAMFDTDMNYIAVSDYWYKDYNLKTDIIGKNHYDVFPEIKKNKEWMDIHKKCLKGHTEKKDEDRFVRANGAVEWLKWEIQPWKNQDGSIGGIIMFTQLITKQKQIQMELKNHRDALQKTSKEHESILKNKAAFMDNNPAPLMQTDTKGNIITRNHAMQKLLLFSEEQKTLKDLFPKHIQEINQKIALRKQFQIRKTISDKLFSFTFIYSIETNSIYVYGTDISKQKENEKELRMLKYSIDNGMVSVLWINPDGSIFYVNDAACENLKYEKEELLALNVTDVNADITREQWLEYYKNIKKIKSDSFESTQINKDGTKTPISINIKYLFYENQEYLVAFAIDVSERKKAEKELLLRTKQLNDFNQAMIGRELKVIDLKKEINNLCRDAGKKEPYPAVWDE